MKLLFLFSSLHTKRIVLFFFRVFVLQTYPVFEVLPFRNKLLLVVQTLGSNAVCQLEDFKVYNSEEKSHLLLLLNRNKRVKHC